MNRKLFQLLSIITFSLVCLLYSPYPVHALTTNYALGEHRLLIMLYNWQDDPGNKPFTKEDVQAAYFSAADSVDFYFRQNSYNKTWVTGEVVDWFTIPLSGNSGCVSLDEDVIQNARDQGINVNDYPHWIFITGVNTNCGAGGASLGGNPTYATITNTLNRSVLVHELGHNLSVNHANSLDCGDKTIKPYAQCTIHSYGDITSGMGYSWYNKPYHFNAVMKSYLNWVHPSQVLEVKNGGIYSIYALEDDIANFQVLKIRKRDTGEYYFLEYRQPRNIDTDLPAGITDGVLLHMGKFIPSFYNGVFYHPESFLLDAHPETKGIPDGYNDASLRDTEIFFDSQNQITIQQLSHDGNQVTILIDMPFYYDGDVNSDGGVDMTDIRILLPEYFTHNSIYDINNDMTVNSFDYTIVSSDYGK